MYRLSGRGSKLYSKNKLLLYIKKKYIIINVDLQYQTLGNCQELQQRFQNKVIRAIVDVPRYLPKSVIQRYIPIATIKEVIAKHSQKYRDWVSMHPTMLDIDYSTKGRKWEKQLLNFALDLKYYNTLSIM